MSEFASISNIKKRLTLCENVVKSNNYQDSIKFFVNNAITNFEKLSAEYLDFNLEIHMELAAPRYAISQNSDGSYFVGKYFGYSSVYQKLPNVEYYQAFKEAVIAAKIKSAAYFTEYEQNQLTTLQNVLAQQNITYEHVEENFCSLIDQVYRSVECISGECSIYDSHAVSHQEL